METLSLPSALQASSEKNTNRLNDEVIKSIMYAYLHEVLPVIDKLFTAVSSNDYKLLPVLSQKLRPFFQSLGISTEPLEKMEHPEDFCGDFRSVQKLYLKVKSMSETAIDEVKSRLISIQAKDFSKPEVQEVISMDE